MTGTNRITANEVTTCSAKEMKKPDCRSSRRKSALFVLLISGPEPKRDSLIQPAPSARKAAWSTHAARLVLVVR